MTENSVQIPRPPAVGPVAALFLSAFILPGLGQMLTGRLGRGLAMAGVLALWLPAALIKVGRDLAVIMPELMAKSAGGAAPTFADLQAALQPLAPGLVWVFAPALMVWFWALSDSVIYLVQNRR